MDFVLWLAISKSAIFKDKYTFSMETFCFIESCFFFFFFFFFYSFCFSSSFSFQMPAYCSCLTQKSTIPRVQWTLWNNQRRYPVCEKEKKQKRGTLQTLLSFCPDLSVVLSQLRFMTVKKNLALWCFDFIFLFFFLGTAALDHKLKQTLAAVLLQGWRGTWCTIQETNKQTNKKSNTCRTEWWERGRQRPRCSCLLMSIIGGEDSNRDCHNSLCWLVRSSGTRL